MPFRLFHRCDQGLSADGIRKPFEKSLIKNFTLLPDECSGYKEEVKETHLLAEWSGRAALFQDLVCLWNERVKIKEKGDL